MEFQDLIEVDHKSLWHPFTQYEVWKEHTPLIVERAEGFELIDVQGKRYLDGVSSIWCNVHGHAVPELNKALHDQVDRVCHSTLLGLSHVEILKLTKKLLAVVPDNLSRVFYCDSGSNAVEAALRMALEYWQKTKSKAGKNKTRLLSLSSSYHGDTLGSVGVGYMKEFHHSLQNSVVQALRVNPPHIYRFYEDYSPEQAREKAVGELKELLVKSADSIAAFVVEPLVQGAAGIWLQDEVYLKEVEELCRQHDVLLIADEVATGFGKTAEMFAVQRAGINPDILVMGKGITAGLNALSAACATEEIFSAFKGEVEELKTFFYGQTYAGNALSAAVAVANLDLFERNSVIQNVKDNEKFLKNELSEKITCLDHVDEVRQCGIMTGIELTKVPDKRVPYPGNEQTGIRIVEAAREKGVIVRPLGNVLVLMPAVAMPQKMLSRLIDVVRDSILEVTSS